MRKWFIIRMLLRRRVLLAWVFALCCATAGAQCGDRSTEGTDFWVMFLTNYVANSDLTLVVTARQNSSVRVLNPRTSFDTLFVVYAHGSTTVTIPALHGTTSGEHEVSNGALHVTSTTPISLYASNFMNASFDMTTILPTSTLRSRYISQTYDELDYGEEIGFVATQDNTVISYTLPENFSYDGFNTVSGAESVTLMRGQTYQIVGHNLASMEVTSNDKPFAMFQGSKCTFIGGVGACDHLYEQCFPVDYWGTRFMLVSTANRPSGDMVLITSSADGCVLTLDGDSVIATIDAGETYNYRLPTETAKMLNASKPVTVCVYLVGAAANNDLGDPAAVIIPPVEQGVDQTTFQAVNTTLTTMHYANIIARNEDLATLMLDGQPIGNQFHRTSWGYAYSRLSLEPGVHTLNSTAQGHFLAYFYGLGTYESYAYIAASAIVDLTEKLFIDSLYTRLLTSVPQYCVGDSVHFHIESDEESLPVTWLMDSDIVDQGHLGIVHAFSTPGDHTMSAVVHFCDTLSVNVHINPTYDITFVDSICSPGSIEWHGHTFDADTFFTDTLRTHYHLCDSITRLNLSVIQSPDVPMTVFVDCHEAIYTVAVDPTLAGCPFTWGSVPYDPLLAGHEHDTLIHILPQEPTRYSAVFDYRCPFAADTVVNPIVWPHADWTVSPQRLSVEHPWLDAYDRTLNGIWRQWFAEGELLPESGRHLRHFVSSDLDSVLLTLVVGSGTCTDTIARTIPFGHEALWAPTAFTPGEVTNNRFSVVVNDGVAESLFIFNRNGLLVSRIDDAHPEWDGTRDGEPCPQGAYVWQLHFRTADQPARTQVLTGTVTLIR